MTGYKRKEDRVYYRLKTHLEMLQDSSRCLAYQRALASIVKDKIVLDVGCGSGILSFFAARSGARQVFAVDIDIPPGIEEIARINGLSHRIQFIPGKIQDIQLPIDSVDIIVSEWMGGLLLMEDMLPAVLYSRDRWLKPDGLLFPDQARLYLAPLDNVAGIGSNDLPTLRRTISSQMWVSMVHPSKILAEPACILDLNLYTLKESTIKSYKAPFYFFPEKKGTFNGLGLWFDVVFNQAKPMETLSTAPWLPPTHWGQGLWILPEDIGVDPGDEISGYFNQTKIVPSTASFETEINIKRQNNKSNKQNSYRQSIEAHPSNMNQPGMSEEQIALAAQSGQFSGQNCIWIGCSFSFAALSVARNGAKNLIILNHSPWANQAMKQLASQLGLTNILFSSQIPSAEELREKNIQLLGSADNSWQAFKDHIKVQALLGEANDTLEFYWHETPWRNFYGFDFTPFSKYDLEMSFENTPSTDNPLNRKKSIQLLINNSQLERSISESQVSLQEREHIYQGVAKKDPPSHFDIHDGQYNAVRVNFSCGIVALPLPEVIKIDSQNHQVLQQAKLTISILGSSMIEFRIEISTTNQTIQQDYHQKLSGMGHIVNN